MGYNLYTGTLVSNGVNPLTMEGYDADQDVLLEKDESWGE